MAIDLLTYEFLKRYVEGEQLGKYAKPRGQWKPNTTYSTGDYVTYKNSVYIVSYNEEGQTQEFTSTEQFNPNNWQQIASSNSIEIDNLNIENGPSGYGSNNLQQKLEVKNNTTTTHWSSQNSEVKTWGDKNNGDDSNTIQRDDKDNIKVGVFATENGGNAAVFGGKSQASGGKSFAAGSKNIALGNNSTAFGNENFAAGQHSFTTGQTNAALGNASFAAGNKTIAKNKNDMSVGYYTIANGHKPKDMEDENYHYYYKQAYPQFVIGRLNEEDKDCSKTITEDSSGQNILNKKAFIIGGGSEEWGGETATYNHKNVASIDYHGNMELAGSIILTDTEDATKKYKLTITNGAINIEHIL